MAERITIEIRGVDRASGAIRSVSSSLGRMSSIIGGLIGFRLLERLGQALMGLGRAALKAYEWFDRVRFSLGELARADILDGMDRLLMTTKDWESVASQAAGSAKELLDWVIRIALASPFGAEDINRMFRLTRAYGFMTNEAKELTEIILDFAAATGFGRETLERMGLALGQVRQRGRLAGEEIRQLINVGIPVRDIVSKALGVTTAEFEKMLRAGKIMADVALPALVNWMRRFDGASERAVATWWGLLSNMKDVKELNMIAVFDGIAKALTPALQTLFDYLTSEAFMGALARLGERIGDFLAPLATGLPKALTQLKLFQTAIMGIVEGRYDPGGAIAFLLEFLDVIELSEKAAVKESVNNFVDGIGRMADKVGELADVWVGPLIEKLPGWLETIAGIEWMTFDEFVDGFGLFVDEIKNLSAIAAPVILENLMDFLTNMTEWWTGGASTDAAGILDFLLTLVGAGVLGGLAIFTALLGAISDILVGKDPLPRMLALFEMLEGLATVLTETTIFQGFAESLSQLVALSMLDYEDVIAATGASVGDILIDGLLKGVTDNEEKVAADLTAFLDGVGYTAEHWSTLTGEQQMDMIGAQLIRSLGNGFVREAEAVEGRLEEVLNRILALVNKIYDIKSPSKVFFNIGRNMMEGLTIGIASGIKKAVKQMTKASRQVIAAARQELEVASPSKVMARIGAEVTAGLARGITAAAAAPAAAGMAAGMGGGMAQPAGAAPTIVYAPTLSLADEKEFITKIAPLISAAFRLLTTRRDTISTYRDEYRIL